MKKILLLYLFLEAIISISVIQFIGGWFIIQTILSFLFGVFLIKANFARFVNAIKLCKQLDTKLKLLLKENLGTILGAVCLMIPGALTDILGLLLQVRLTSKLFIKLGGNNHNFKEETRKHNEKIIIDYDDTANDYSKY